MKSKIALIFTLLLTNLGLFAESVTQPAASGISNEVLYMIYFVVALFLIVAVLLLQITLHLKKFVKGDFESEEYKMYEKRSTWEKIFQIKPVGTDKDTMIHEAHDGIYELDNPPPPWFMFLFYGCIVFAIVYVFRYEITGSGPSQEEEYIAEMDVATEQREVLLEKQDMGIDESTVVLLTDAADLEIGEQIYAKNCQVCHAEGGLGSTGPNLTDEYWKHGGGVVNVFKTVKYGVIEKGMIPWKDQFSPKMIQQVASYILTLQGTSPGQGKAPEGEKWVPEEETEAAVESDEEESEVEKIAEEEKE